MSFDFPNSPSQGQEYTPIVNGLTYVYINTQWVVKDQDAPNNGLTYGRKNKQWQQVNDQAYADAPVDGVAYVRRNNAWIPAVQIADVAPSTPYVGQLWWNSTNGNFYLYYNDGTSSQWVQINGAT
jgi:hypothetical protein